MFVIILRDIIFFSFFLFYFYLFGNLLFANYFKISRERLNVLIDCDVLILLLIYVSIIELFNFLLEVKNDFEIN